MIYVNLLALYGTMSSPKRPRAHITGDRAVQIYQAACDPSWAITDPTPDYGLAPDYGLDLRMELTAREFVTGREILVQVKGRSNRPTLFRCRGPRGRPGPHRIINRVGLVEPIRQLRLFSAVAVRLQPPTVSFRGTDDGA